MSMMLVTLTDIGADDSADADFAHDGIVRGLNVYIYIYIYIHTRVAPIIT